MALINPSHLFRATRHSLAGLATAFRGEQAFRHEVLVLPVLVLALVLTGKSAVIWLAVLGGWLAVMVVELLNSGIEKVCDVASPEWHPLIKASKDMASAAIFLTLLVNAGLWLVVFVL